MMGLGALQNEYKWKFQIPTIPLSGCLQREREGTVSDVYFHLLNKQAELFMFEIYNILLFH